MIARLVAGLAATALAVALPATLLAHNLASVLFEPRALAENLSEGLIQSGLLRDALVDSLLGASGESGDLSLAVAMQDLSGEQRQSIADSLLPERWLQEQLAQAMADLFAWFDSPSNRLFLTVDTSQLTAGLEQEAPTVVEMMVESWPACTLDDVGQMIGQGALPGQQGFPVCEPPEPLRTVVVSSAAGALRLVGQSLPNRIPFVDETFPDTDQLLEAKERVRMVRFFSRWGLLACLGLLGVVTMAAVRSWKGLARWWGIPLLLGGVLAFLPVFAGQGLVRWFMERLAPGLGESPALAELVRAMLHSVSAAVLRSQAWQSAVLVVFGIGLTVLSVLGRGDKPWLNPPKAPQVPPVATPDDTEEPRERPSGMFG